jgi:hypothetical protein
LFILYIIASDINILMCIVLAGYKKQHHLLFVPYLIAPHPPHPPFMSVLFFHYTVCPVCFVSPISPSPLPPINPSKIPSMVGVEGWGAGGEEMVP